MSTDRRIVISHQGTRWGGGADGGGVEKEGGRERGSNVLMQKMILRDK